MINHTIGSTIFIKAYTRRNTGETSLGWFKIDLNPSKSPALNFPKRNFSKLINGDFEINDVFMSLSTSFFVSVRELTRVLYFFNEYFLQLYTSDFKIIQVAQPALFVVLLASLIVSAPSNALASTSSSEVLFK